MISLNASIACSSRLLLLFHGNDVALLLCNTVGVDVRCRIRGRGHLRPHTAVEVGQTLVSLKVHRKCNTIHAQSLCFALSWRLNIKDGGVGGVRQVKCLVRVPVKDGGVWRILEERERDADISESEIVEGTLLYAAAP